MTFLLVLSGVALVLALGLPKLTARGADHLDAPLVQADGRLDITDVYAFASGSNTVLIMNVNPLAGALNPTALRPGAKYEFAIDNDGDALEDIVHLIQASAPDKNGIQQVNLRQAGGGWVLAKGPSDDILPVKGGGNLFVGLRDDPFFFDLLSLGSLSFCPTDPAPDFFAGLDVSAIVLEVPTSDLTGATDVIGVWARTEFDGNQIDRMGRPVINTVLIPAGSKDAFNTTVPSADVATWTAAVIASLIGLNGDAAYSAVVAAIVLPDILTYDTSVAANFIVLNGRDLDDDVIDKSLDVVSMGAITTDCVGANDVPFLTSFPYLAPPH